MKTSRGSGLSPLPALTLVAASVFHDLGGRRLCRDFEDAGLVELQLFNALVDVAEGSETENTQLFSFVLNRELTRASPGNPIFFSRWVLDDFMKT